MYECGVYKYAPRVSEKKQCASQVFHDLFQEQFKLRRSTLVVARNIEALAKLQLYVL